MLFDFSHVRIIYMKYTIISIVAVTSDVFRLKLYLLLVCVGEATTRSYGEVISNSHINIRHVHSIVCIT